jgi:hypothetical protein
MSVKCSQKTFVIINEGSGYFVTSSTLACWCCCLQGGHRAFDGPKKTVNPDIVLLAELLADESFGWEEFSKRVQKGHLSRVGQVKLRKAGQSVYTYPAPDCMCSTRNETYRT